MDMFANLENSLYICQQKRKHENEINRKNLQG